MTSLVRDLRYGLKVLARRPLLTGAAIVCLALGIGANTVVFSLVNGILLRPLPYAEPDRIVMVWNQFLRAGVTRAPSSGKELLDYRDQNRTFEQVAGLLYWYFNLTSEEVPERLVGGRVSASLFPLLGVEARRGRTFLPEEETQSARVALLSHDLWQRRFGGDPDLIDRSIGLAEIPHTVVGVLPRDLQYPLSAVDVFVPWTPNLANPRTRRGAQVLARMKPGESLATAQADMDTLAARFRQDHPEVYPADSGWGLKVAPLHEEVVGDVRPQLLILAGAVTLVLLIACGNVANLLLAQATIREREIALRAALGAGPLRVVRQLVTESLLLAALGGTLGLLLAYWGSRAVVALDLGELPRLDQVAIDWRVLVFTFAVSLVTGLVFGALPALRAGRKDLHGTLKEGGRSAAAGGGHVLRRALVAAEIALALIVLVNAGLMIRSLSYLQGLDPGFRTRSMVTMQMFLPRAKYPERHQRVSFYHRLLGRIAEQPEIRTAGVVSHLPLGQLDLRGEIAVEGRELAPGEANPAVGWRMISPDYFEAMAIPLLQGRVFTTLDHGDSLPVVIIDAAMARRLWPEEDPLGKRLKLDSPFDREWREVVGVVGQIQHQELGVDSDEQLYIPFPQYPTPVLALALETAIPPEQAAAAVREAIRDIDPAQPIDSVRTMEEVVHSSMSRPRFNRLLFGLFGAAALILATVGIYGVMAYSVTQRTGEIGLRMALGARRRDVLRLILGQGLRLAALGIGLGLTAALGLGRVWQRWLEDLVHGVGTLDLMTFVAVPLLLTAVAVLACLVPAWRAARVAPQVALREE